MLRPMLKAAICGAAALAVTGLAVPGDSRAEETITLKMAHFLPTANGMHSDFMEPWARELEKRTDGKVKVEIYPAGTQLGNITKLYDEVRAGVVDIAHGLRGIPRGRFQKTSVIELPFMTGSADVASRALWSVFDEHLKDEYPGVKVLALHAHNGGLIHTADTPVEKLEDLKGLRLRFPSGPIKALLESLGATPQGLPPGQVYEAIQKGTIDGTVFPWDPMASFKLGEVTNYHTEAGGIYTVSFWFAMNQRTYDNLPADVRKVVDEMSGEALVAKFGDWWNKWDQAGKEASEGDKVIVLDPAERARWEAAAKPVRQAWLDKLEAEGNPEIRDVYKAVSEKIEELEGR